MKIFKTFYLLLKQVSKTLPPGKGPGYCGPKVRRLLSVYLVPFEV